LSATKNRKSHLNNKGIQAKTGKTYSDWFAILDAAGASKMSYKEIVTFLQTRYRLGRWWAQKLTIIYEQERGLREKHQTQSGYQISVSRTLPFPVSTLFKMWHDMKVRSKWLIESNKSLVGCP
jgi:hypothetical protein